MIFGLSLWALPLFGVLLIVGNIVRQFLPRRKEEPPLVFHWFPIIGNAISYGQDPVVFFTQCREKVRDCFSLACLPEVKPGG